MNLTITKSAQKELDKLPDAVALQISQMIFKLAENPYGQGIQKLAGDKGYRARVGNYRIVYLVGKVAKEVRIVKCR